MPREEHRAAWESAVVVRVPALDELIDSLRRRFMLPRKPNGISSHITVAIPFLPHAELAEPQTVSSLRDVCAGVEPFELSFARTARFPHVLYLAPEPSEPLLALNAALTQRWPELRRAAAQKQLTPHLTVSTGRPPKVFHQVDEALRPSLPVRVEVEAAQLYLFDGRRWSEEAVLPLGQA